jgi:hypothetical protein
MVVPHDSLVRVRARVRGRALCLIVVPHDSLVRVRARVKGRALCLMVVPHDSFASFWQDCLAGGAGTGLLILQRIVCAFPLL